MRRRQLLVSAGVSAVGLQGLSSSAAACQVNSYSKYYKNEATLEYEHYDKIYGHQTESSSVELVMEIRDGTSGFKARVSGAWAKIDNYLGSEFGFDEITLKIESNNSIVFGDGSKAPVIRLPNSDTAAVDFDADEATETDSDGLLPSVNIEYPALDSRPVKSEGMCGPDYALVVEGMGDEAKLHPTRGAGEEIDSLPDWTDYATDDAKENTDGGLLPI